MRRHLNALPCWLLQYLTSKTHVILFYFGMCTPESSCHLQYSDVEVLHRLIILERTHAVLLVLKILASFVNKHSRVMMSEHDEVLAVACLLSFTCYRNVNIYTV